MQENQNSKSEEVKPIASAAKSESQIKPVEPSTNQIKPNTPTAVSGIQPSQTQMKKESPSTDQPKNVGKSVEEKNESALQTQKVVSPPQVKKSEVKQTEIQQDPPSEKQVADSSVKNDNLQKPIEGVGKEKQSQNQVAVDSQKVKQLDDKKVPAQNLPPSNLQEQNSKQITEIKGQSKDSSVETKVEKTEQINSKEVGKKSLDDLKEEIVSSQIEQNHLNINDTKKDKSDHFPPQKLENPDLNVWGVPKNTDNENSKSLNVDSKAEVKAPAKDQESAMSNQKNGTQTEDLEKNKESIQPDKDKTAKSVTFQAEQTTLSNKSPSKPAPAPSQEVYSFDGIGTGSNACSIPKQEYVKRLQHWISNMRLFKLVNCEKLPPPKHNQSKLFAVNLNLSEPKIQVPASYKDENKYRYSLQMNLTLCDPSVGLFGRTATIKSGPSGIANDLSFNQYVILHSDIDLSQTHIICEIILNVYDVKQKDVQVSNISLGIAAIKLLKEDGNAAGEIKEPVHLATPRSFVIFDKGQSIQQKLKQFKTNVNKYEVLANVHELKLNPTTQQLTKLISPACLTSPQDLIPGIQGDHLPPQWSVKAIDEIQYDKTSQIWAHQLKAENLDQVDALFNKYLKSYVSYIGYKAEIVSRKITMTCSNSCHLYQSSSQIVELKAREIKGQLQFDYPKQAVKIQNLASNRMSCILFRILFKVKYQSHGNADVFREFVLGRYPFFPNFDLQLNSGIIKDRVVEFNLSMCPEINMINDLLWDSNIGNLSPADLFIKVKMILSNSEDLKSEQDQQLVQQKYIQNELEKKQKMELQKGGDPNKIDEEAIKKIAQMEMQKAQLENAYKQMLKQKEDEVLKVKEEAQLLKEKMLKEQEKMLKEQEENDKKKPVEVPVLNFSDFLKSSQKDGKDIPYLDSLIEELLVKGKTDVRECMELLKKIIEHSKGNKAKYKDIEEKLLRRIIALLEQDPTTQIGRFSSKSYIYKFNDLSEDAKFFILRDSALQGHFPIGDIQMVDYMNKLFKPSLEIEAQDLFKACTISFKFLTFRTASQLCHQVVVPKSLFFTFKFYSFSRVESEQVVLKPHNSIVTKNQDQLKLQNWLSVDASGNSQGQVILDNQFALMKCKKSQSNQNQKSLELGGSLERDLQEYAVTGHGLAIDFDIDTTSSIKVQSEQTGQLFPQYLHENSITVDLWNADSLMHFGSCDIPLFMLMRQGEPSKIIDHEFDVIEPEQARKVGQLQVIISNVGRQVNHDSIKPAGEGAHNNGTQRTKKIVTSHPMDPYKAEELSQNHINDGQQSQNQTIQAAEDQRKKLRVEGLRRQKLGSQSNGQTMIDDTTASEWEETQRLEQIELMRAKQKAEILSKVQFDSWDKSQKALKVISGEPSYFEVEVKNFSESSQTFKIQIQDDDLDWGFIHTPELVLVDNMFGEWENCYQKKLCKQKPESSTQVDAKLNEAKIGAGLSVSLLFKFQTFRGAVCERTKRRKNRIRDEHLEINPKSIRLGITDSQGGLIEQLLINIQPFQKQFHKIYRFYEVQNTQSFSKLPSIVNLLSGNDQIPLTCCKIVSSNPRIKIETTGETLVAVLNNGPSMSCEKGLIYVYKDQYRSELIGACQIEIHSLVQIQLKVLAGEEYDYDFWVINPASSKEGVKERQIELFSANPQLVYAPYHSAGKQRNIYTLKAIKDTAQKIPVSIMCRQSGISQTRVHCVDTITKETIETFLLQFDAEKPTIDKVMQVVCIVGQDSVYKKKYKNPFQKNEMVFSFISSDASIVQPKNEYLKFAPGGAQELQFFVPKQTSEGSKEAYIYVSTKKESKEIYEDDLNNALDEEENPYHSEVILLQILVKSLSL